jgi:hypothetical protein
MFNKITVNADLQFDEKDRTAGKDDVDMAENNGEFVMDNPIFKQLFDRFFCEISN